MKVTTIHDLASAARGRRLELGLTQAELAEGAGVSRDWVNYFERGKRTVELGLVLHLLEALGLEMELTPAQAGENQRDSAASDLRSFVDEYMGR
jgi:HTH-type transcriptional regulator / antitoxin HipB